MRIHLLLLLLITIGFTSCKEPQNASFSLNGEWQFAKEGDTAWMSAQVPGSVQSDLLKLQKIPDPFKSNNEDSIQWISDENWTYKKRFLLSDEILERNKHILQLKGLDTYAKVYLNDSLILESNNAFRSWEIDLSDALKSENEIHIQFQSLDSIESSEASKLNYKLPESPRVFSRKPQFQYGWDWGPTIKTMGIWRDISLYSYNDARIKDGFIEIEDISNDSVAKLVAHVELKIETPQKLSLEIENETARDIKLQSIDASPNTKSLSVPLTIEKPVLWWTHNLGDPFLYTYKIRLKKGRTVIDSVSLNVGLRTIELITDNDSIGSQFYFKLNGKPVYMKGANYIPQNILLTEVNLSDRQKLLDDVVEANMNMLRVWGGGIYEDDDFYNLCDEKGILIWQDFMYACAIYPGDPSFLENAKQEAVENVKRLRQHPSIALWCGNNENSEGWFRWGWQDGKTEAQKQEIWEGYYGLFNDILPRVVDSLSRSTSYWESSPKYGRGDKRYQFEGDAHDWWVWHDGYPFEHFEKEVPRFMSEFGFQSFPSYKAISYFTEQIKIDLQHPAFATHQKHSRGFALIEDYMRRDFPLPEKGEDYVYMSQLLQAYGISKGIHAHRRAKPYNMGSLYWQLNDCWPVVSWSSIDGLGNWKALHYEAKRAFENILLSTSLSDETLNIHLINDTFSEVANDLNITHLDFFGNELSLETMSVLSKPLSSEIVYKFSLKTSKFDPNATFLRLTFGKSETLHFFVKPKDLQLTKSEIKTTIKKVEYGYIVTLQSETLQKNVFLNTESQGKWSDNFFDLLPNESTTLLFSSDINGTPTIEIKSLNQFIQN